MQSLLRMPRRKINRKCMITFLLVFAFLLSVWNLRSCKTFPDLTNTDEKSRDVIANKNDVITENDLLNLNPTKMELRELKRIHRDKIKDLKKRKVWKRFEARQPCKHNQQSATVCVDTACTSSLAPASSDVNLQSVFKPLSRVKDVHVRLAEALGGTINSSAVTFITAVSSDHYLESQALIKNLHRTVFPRLTNFTFYYYDLGLEPAQRRQLMTYCKCEVRSYPLHILPKRFSYLRGFTWKPIIMQAHLPHTDILVWVDSSVRFRNGNLQPLFDEARSTGLLLSNVRFAVAEHTSRKMFEYFSGQACEFSVYNEAEAGFQVLHNELFVREVLLKTWWACAVDPDCMCSEYVERQFHCNPNVRRYSKCHRFDQSALTVILAKLFREHIATFYVRKGKYHIIKRHHTENYFEELEKERLKN